MSMITDYSKTTILSSPTVTTQNKKGFTYQLSSFGQAFVDAASKSNMPVMDIGAAYGVATIPALKGGATVMAVDVEEKHLLHIAEALEENQLKSRFIPLCEKFPHFDIPAQSLAAVYMSQVLPFLKGSEIEEGFRKIYDWLIPGGECIVVSFTPYIKHVESFIPIYEENKRRGVKWAGYIEDVSRFSDDREIYSQLPNKIHHVDKEDLKAAAEEVGFEIKELRYFGEEEGTLPSGIRYDGRERVGLVAVKPLLGKKTGREGEWRKISEVDLQSISLQVREWLYKPEVLTQALRKVCHDFTVKVKKEDITELYIDEREILQCESKGYIRETYLGGESNPLVYARVTMPERTYQYRKQKFAELADRPIGESLLYTSTDVKREAFEVKKLTLNDELLFDHNVHDSFFRVVIAHTAPFSELWARRSLFLIADYPLLITEVFLADIPPFME